MQIPSDHESSRPSDSLLRKAFAQVEEILELDAEARGRVLDELSRSHAELLQLVQTLLRAADDATRHSFLSGSAVIDEDCSDSAGFKLQSGSQLGNYRVEAALGRGGMGEVWRARRTDGAYEAAIALKVLHSHLAVGFVRERFVREGRILGALSHSNIARLLDAGVSADGQLYLVLELVEGSPIDEWCDTHVLDLPARVRLFMQVCDAVSYAHAHMVVHRDLKPSNILVTEDGTIKLLDFGIAKLVSDGSAGIPAADLTLLGERALTPDYAAPEQLRGETTSAATDFYALGILLYRLASGHKPYSSGNRSLRQLERDITGGGLPAPSAAAAFAGTALHGRAGSSRELRKLLRGGLDSIVAKSLRPAADDRYSDARALRDDLGRYLAHEPVLARTGARAYVWRLFLRRHWKPLITSGALLVVLFIGTVAVGWQAHLARVEAAKALAVKKFLLDIFRQNSQQSQDVEQARHTTAQQMLDIGSAKILTGLRDQPEVRDELLSTVGDLYDQMDLYDQDVALTRERLADLEKRGRVASSEFADAQLNLGHALYMNGDWQEASSMLTQSLHTMDLIKDLNSARRAFAMLQLARIDYQTKPADYPETVELLQRAVAVYDRCCLEDGDRAGSIQTLARVFEKRGDYPAAEREYHRAIDLISQRTGDSRLDRARAYDDLGSFYLVRHRYVEAERDLRMAGDMLAQAEGAETIGTNVNRSYQAQALVALNRPAEGTAMVIDALRSMERLDGPDKIGSTVPIRSIAISIELQRGDLAAPSAHLDLNHLSFTRLQQVDVATCSQRCALSSSLQAQLWMAQGRYADAAAALDLAEGALQRLHSDKTESYATVQILRADLDVIREHYDLANAKSRAIIAAFPATDTELPEPYVLANLNQASAALSTDLNAAYAVADALLERILALPDHEYFAEWEARAQRLAGLALTAGCKPLQAEPHLRRAMELRELIDVPASPWLADSRVDLAIAMIDAGKRLEVSDLLGRASQTITQAPSLAKHYRERLQVAQALLRDGKRQRQILRCAADVS